MTSLVSACTKKGVSKVMVNSKGTGFNPYNMFFCVQVPTSEVIILNLFAAVPNATLVSRAHILFAYYIYLLNSGTKFLIFRLDVVELPA